MMLPGLICSSYLDLLRQCDFDPLAQNMLSASKVSAARVQLSMLKSLWTKTI